MLQKLLANKSKRMNAILPTDTTTPAKDPSIKDLPGLDRVLNKSDRNAEAPKEIIEATRNSNARAPRGGVPGSLVPNEMVPPDS
jgi:hypothetical protein